MFVVEEGRLEVIIDDEVVLILSTNDFPPLLPVSSFCRLS